MFRSKMEEKGVGYEKDFRWRGGDVSRIEGFSDAVFAFAVTLLVVSLEVPRTYSELLNTMRGFVAFGLCFMILIWIWYSHYIYFRRYGLQTPLTITLNSILLFVVLFYIYPLKFLFTHLINMWFGFRDDKAVTTVIKGSQMPSLMIIYSLGFLAIFLIFLMLYIYAYHKRFELELDEVEIFWTKFGIHVQIIYINLAIVSISLAVASMSDLIHSFWAGVIYCIIGPIRAIHGITMEKRLDKLKTMLS